MLARKILSNFGIGSMRALGVNEYLKYLRTGLRRLPQVLASGSLRPIDMEKRGVITLRHPVTRRCVNIDLDLYRSRDVEEGTYSFGGVRELWMRNVYFREFALPDRLSGVIDLGANRGLFSLLAASMADRVVAVEALNVYRTAMRKNLAMNDLHNVNLINAFVSTPAALSPLGNQVISFKRIIDEFEDVPIDFLKVDIEGSEFGLEITQFRSVKRVAMELHPEWGDVAKLIEELRSCGFSCRTYDEALNPTESANADFVYGINGRFAEAVWARCR